MTNERISFAVMRCFAAGCAFCATAKVAYDYYTLTRWIVFSTCAWGLFFCRRRVWQIIAPAYVLIGVLFNPILPFYFSRKTWHNLDILAGVVLLATIYFDGARRNSIGAKQPDKLDPRGHWRN